MMSANRPTLERLLAMVVGGFGPEIVDLEQPPRVGRDVELPSEIEVIDVAVFDVGGDRSDVRRLDAERDRRQRKGERRRVAL